MAVLLILRNVDNWHDVHKIISEKEEFDLEFFLQLSYVWFKTCTQMFYNHRHQQWSKHLKFPEELSNLCLTEETLINQLDPKEFLLMMHNASMYRRIPRSLQSRINERMSSEESAFFFEKLAYIPHVTVFQMVWNLRHCLITEENPYSTNK